MISSKANRIIYFLMLRKNVFDKNPVSYLPDQNFKKMLRTKILQKQIIKNLIL
jgi:hypothetical protein